MAGTVFAIVAVLHPKDRMICVLWMLRTLLEIQLSVYCRSREFGLLCSSINNKFTHIEIRRVEHYTYTVNYVGP